MAQNILLLFGTRPEAIKMCPLALELSRRGGLRTRVCLTGQHREMLTQAMEDLGVGCDRSLEVMEEEQPLGALTCRLLERVTAALREERPDRVLVHGDTTTAFAGALAAFYLGIPVGHVEAGLRTWDLSAPFPEEFNRQAVDRLADWRFAPTPQAARNLLREGCPPDRVYVTGNTVVDALCRTLRADYTHPALTWAGSRPLVLLTVHRRENLRALGALFETLGLLVRHHPEAAFLFPVHRNPQVRRQAYGLLGGLDNLRLVNPLGVRDFHNLLARSALVLTDSGGVQEEAAVLGRPVLVLRERTERPEGVAPGCLHLTGTDEAAIRKNFESLLEKRETCAKIQIDLRLYGDGQAARRIADCLEAGRPGPPWTPQENEIYRVIG